MKKMYNFDIYKRIMKSFVLHIQPRQAAIDPRVDHRNVSVLNVGDTIK